jgi:hypothetical protein
MNEPSKKGIGATPMAIIIGALMVSASVLFAVSPYGLGGARTVTKIETTTSISATMVGLIQLHKVTFNASSLCPSGYADEWAVTLGNIILSEPSNVTFPFSGGELFSSAGQMISKITFTVPDGTYDYNVSKSADAYPASGTVEVHGSDVLIQILEEPATTCGLGGGLG